MISAVALCTASPRPLSEPRLPVVADTPWLPCGSCEDDRSAPSDTGTRSLASAPRTPEAIPIFSDRICLVQPLRNESLEQSTPVTAQALKPWISALLRAFAFPTF